MSIIMSIDHVDLDNIFVLLIIIFSKTSNDKYVQLSFEILKFNINLALIQEMIRNIPSKKFILNNMMSVSTAINHYNIYNKS